MYIETLENLFHFHKSFYSEQDALWQKKKKNLRRSLVVRLPLKMWIM